MSSSNSRSASMKAWTARGGVGGRGLSSTSAFRSARHFLGLADPILDNKTMIAQMSTFVYQNKLQSCGGACLRSAARSGLCYRTASRDRGTRGNPELSLRYRPCDDAGETRDGRQRRRCCLPLDSVISGCDHRAQISSGRRQTCLGQRKT